MEGEWQEEGLNWKHFIPRAGQSGASLGETGWEGSEREITGNGIMRGQEKPLSQREREGESVCVCVCVCDVW